MRALSGGMKRRVLVAQALVHRPPVIVLDEPTAGVDVELRQTLWRFIQRLNNEGHTIVLTTHYLEEAEALCGRIAMLKAGRIVALDSTRNLLRQFSAHALRVRLADGAVLPVELSAKAARKGDSWQIPFQAYEQIELLLGQIRASGCVIDDMSIDQPDLEEVFVSVMSREDERG